METVKRALLLLLALPVCLAAQTPTPADISRAGADLARAKAEAAPKPSGAADLLAMNKEEAANKSGMRWSEITVKETFHIPAEHWYSSEFQGVGTVRVRFPKADMIHPHCHRWACAMNIVDEQQPKQGPEITDYDRDGFTVRAPRGHYVTVSWVLLKRVKEND